MNQISTKISLADKLSNLNQPVITEYDLGVLVYWLYLDTQDLLIPLLTPVHKELRAAVDALIIDGILSPFKKIPSVYKIFGKKIFSEKDVVCAINPFAYISHLSAMEYHGLTDKVPRVLVYSTPDRNTWKDFARQKMRKVFKDGKPYGLPHLAMIEIKKFGKKNIIKHTSIHSGAYVNIKDRVLRVSSIGRTFLDMIRKPDLCGGIYNVIQAYEAFSEQYLGLIIDEVERNGSKIEKVRAGYLLEERCGFKGNPIIEKWKKHIQRGGSRRLDPTNEYSFKYSKNWCLSINIEK